VKAVRIVAGLLLLLYLGVAAFIVLVPEGEIPTNSVTAISLLLQEMGAPAWFHGGNVEFVANVLLFVPLTMLGATLLPRWRWWHWLLAGFWLTIAVESWQLAFLPGRSPQLVDVVANTLGALLGYLLVAAVRLATSARAGSDPPSKPSP
jgi:glycopeptide antibiotics resistance protein